MYPFSIRAFPEADSPYKLTGKRSIFANLWAKTYAIIHPSPPEKSYAVYVYQMKTKQQKPNQKNILF